MQTTAYKLEGCICIGQEETPIDAAMLPQATR